MLTSSAHLILPTLYSHKGRDERLSVPQLLAWQSLGKNQKSSSHLQGDPGTQELDLHGNYHWDLFILQEGPQAIEHRGEQLKVTASKQEMQEAVLCGQWGVHSCTRPHLKAKAHRWPDVVRLQSWGFLKACTFQKRDRRKTLTNYQSGAILSTLHIFNIHHSPMPKVLPSFPF